jgi:excisionase family DNA binding protein
MADGREQEQLMQQREVERNWITLQEMQDMLTIGRTKAWQLASSGEVPAVKIGRSVRVDRRGLEEWLSQQDYTEKQESAS